MSVHEYTVEPKSASIGEASVMAKLERDASTDRWDTTVVFSRAADLPLIPAKEVDVQLLQGDGTALKVLTRPSSPLPEVGGSLGVSANAVFRFQGSNVEPTELVVTYKGQTGRFKVVPK